MQSGQRRSKKVKVWMRTRPTAHFAHDMIDLEKGGKSIHVHCQRDPRKGVVNNQVSDWSFKVDGILHNASQEQVFNTTANKMITSTLNGYNGTIMCYGQTGAGKTFTMTGATENYKHRGLIPRSLCKLYKEIEERGESAIRVMISFLEIYNETMIDLLSTLPEVMSSNDQSPLQIVEDESGVWVKNLSCLVAQTEEEALNLLFEGETNRAIGEHTLNKHSSRSHCIFTVYIESRSRVQSEAKYTMSKLNFVDLAGSERLGKTKSEGRTQTEAMYINKSLSFLEQTVIALADKNREHVPFRQTKLTHFLKDSIGGSCNTLLIANIWGEAEQIEETISTLRFGSRMMCVSSEPVINEKRDATIMVKKLEAEISALKSELAMHDTLNNRSQITYDPLSEQQRYEIRSQVRRYLEGSLDEVDIVNVRQILGVYDAFKEIYGQQEKEIEERIRSKYTLIDKTDSSAIAAAQQAGIAIGDDGELVGESDGQGFGVGPAPPGTRAAPSSVVNQRRKDAKRGKSRDRTSPAPNAASPVVSTRGPPGGSISATPSGEKKDDREDAGTPNSSSGGQGQPKVVTVRPSTPPSRLEAFEEFKKEAGSEIQRILTENKEILAGKKKAYADIARQINTTKAEMDTSIAKLNQMRAERENQGVQYNEDGDLVISEPEFLEINRLKDLKAVYRNDFDEMKSLLSEVQYCQKLVDQCRGRIVQEFDQWYRQSFQTEEGKTSAEAGIGVRAGTQTSSGGDVQATQVVEDEQEKFDRLQMALLLENPDSAAFYNAKMRTQRRKTYESAMRQPQPSIRNKPGTPTRGVKQQPPNHMTVYAQ